MRRQNLHNLLSRLARAESAFLAAEFLAPVVRGRGVTVRIANVRCALIVSPHDFSGFGVFRPVSHAAAVLARPASPSQRRQYLELFPAVRAVVIGRMGDAVLASPDDKSDARFENPAPIVVQLVESAELFDTILVRFDGGQFWFDELDARADPAAASYLRRALVAMTEPAELDRPGQSAGQRLAYASELARRSAAILADQENRIEHRARLALGQAGATLDDLTDVNGDVRVSYSVDGARYTSFVRADDLTVVSAGICLSGEDRKFDLNSLVGVLRESER